MKIDSIDVDMAIKNVQKLLDEDKSISLALKAAISVLLILVKTLINRLGLNSNNSSKPPSTDDKSKKNIKKKCNCSRPFKHFYLQTPSELQLGDYTL